MLDGEEQMKIFPFLKHGEFKKSKMILYSFTDPLIPLSLEDFNRIPDGEVFAKGELPDDHNGINMVGTGRMLRWLAKKGYGNDWAIYCYWAKLTITPYPPTDWSYIAKNGDKVKDIDNIKRCITVSDVVIQLYRK